MPALEVGLKKVQGSFSAKSDDQARQTQEFERAVESMGKNTSKRFTDTEATITAQRARIESLESDLSTLSTQVDALQAIVDLLYAIHFPP